MKWSDINPVRDMLVECGFEKLTAESAKGLISTSMINLIKQEYYQYYRNPNTSFIFLCLCL